MDQMWKLLKPEKMDGICASGWKRKTIVCALKPNMTAACGSCMPKTCCDNPEDHPSPFCLETQHKGRFWLRS